MSRTTRSRARYIDYYPTPAWCVHRLLEAVEIRGRRWLEPCVGDGAIVRAVNDVVPGVEWTTVDVRPETNADVIADFTAAECPGLDGNALLWSVAITNPPYSSALEILMAARKRAFMVVLLLRLNWLAGASRHPYISQNMPDVYVLPNRPSFTGTGTDATEYAWMVWDGPWWPRRSGSVSVLDTTPLSQRRARSDGPEVQAAPHK